MELSLNQNNQFDEKLLELSSRIDDFEGYTHAHGLRIAVLADAIAKSFNLAEHDRFTLQQAALMHDIGELVMGRDYIKADRPLTDSERMDMQRHPVIGEQETAKLGLSRGVQLLVRWHHEWWSGMGYPDNMRGDEIPLAARILRLADSFAALRDDRPRRKAMSADEARDYIINWSGIEFDPSVVKVFLTSEHVAFLEFRTPQAASDTPVERTIAVNSSLNARPAELGVIDDQPTASLIHHD